MTEPVTDGGASAPLLVRRHAAVVASLAGVVLGLGTIAASQEPDRGVWTDVGRDGAPQVVPPPEIQIPEVPDFEIPDFPEIPPVDPLVPGSEAPDLQFPEPPTFPTPSPYEFHFDTPTIPAQ